LRSINGTLEMSNENPELDDLHAAYKSAVENWISSIRREEGLASDADHSVVKLDQWEKAHLNEEDTRNMVKAANALPLKFFGF
jgi:hypothetical protein